jgi:hypothetical protein
MAPNPAGMIHRVLLYAVFSVASAACATPVLPTREARQPPTTQLAPCRVPKSSYDVLCGKYGSSRIALRERAAASC